MAENLNHQQRLGEAESTFREALRIDRKRIEQHDGDISAQLDLLQNLMKLGTHHHAQKQYEAAAGVFDEAVNESRRFVELSRQAEDRGQFQHSLFMLQFNLHIMAFNLFFMLKYDEANDILRDAKLVVREYLAVSSDREDAVSSIMSILVRTANELRRRKQVEGTEGFFREALAILIDWKATGKTFSEKIATNAEKTVRALAELVRDRGANE